MLTHICSSNMNLNWRLLEITIGSFAGNTLRLQVFALIFEDKIVHAVPLDFLKDQRGPYFQEPGDSLRDSLKNDNAQ